MSVRVVDSRNDLGNVVVTPEMRCRFMVEQPENQRRWHAHDGASEVFLVLEGTLEVSIESEVLTLTEGQLLHVPPYARHTLRAVGDGPARVFLVVSPHQEPSHTFFDEAGRAEPQHGAWRD
jgi:quercetin dioxygenase-like cupin family protein